MALFYSQITILKFTILNIWNEKEYARRASVKSSYDNTFTSRKSLSTRN